MTFLFRASFRRALMITAVIAPAMAIGTSAIRAADEPTTVGGERRPLLEQLNRETRALYDDVRRSVVRAQLPPQQWLSNYASKRNPLNKYQNLNPDVRKEIERRVRQGPEEDALVRADTRAPETQSSTTDAEGGRSGGTYIVVPPPPRASEQTGAADPVAGGKLDATFPSDATSAFVPDNVGVVLDDQGHVLIPMYVERQGDVDPTIRLAGPAGDVIVAKFVGSDRQTNLTVVKVDKAPGQPARLGGEKPADGSLVMSISPTDGSGRLVVWNGGGAQERGVIFTSDGQMAGVARFGQFLTGSACKLIADQIIRHGSVKRATLGVIITEIGEDDPLRQQVPVLGGRTAMRIDQVMPGSAAEKAGLKAGDLLVALAGESVSDIPSFAAAIAAKSGLTELQLLRDGRLVKVAVELSPK